jgi:nicotinamidase/pyrazinamidase
MPKKALIVVDYQNDFCPGGALPVPEGDQVVDTINDLVDEFIESGNIVVYTKDYHPIDHISFKMNHPEGLWPPHCVQNTAGAEFHPDLKVAGPTFYTAFLSDKESYSGFGGHIEANVETQSLEDYLKEQGVEEVTVVGLALDYCVKATAIDAQKLGFKTDVVLEGTKAINVQPGDDRKTIEELKSQGVRVR